MTLPKEIRKRLGLTAGSRLDFSIDNNGELRARPVATTTLGLAGLLRRPRQPPMTAEQMDEAIEQTAAELNPRVQP